MSHTQPAAAPGPAGLPAANAGSAAHDHDPLQEAAAAAPQRQGDDDAGGEAGRVQPAEATTISPNMALPEASPASAPVPPSPPQKANGPLHVNTGVARDAAAGDGGGAHTTRATTAPLDNADSTAEVEHEVAPPQAEPLVLPGPSSPHDASIGTNTSTTAPVTTASGASAGPPHSQSSTPLTSPNKPRSRRSISYEAKMLFGNRSAAGGAAHRRRVMANTNAITNYEADLTSQDRATQKEAVRSLLAELVKNDWEWVWPPPEPEPVSKDGPQESTSMPEEAHENSAPPVDEASRVSVSTPIADSHEPSPGDSSRGNPVTRVISQGDTEGIVEHACEWKERDEWLSNFSDNEAESTTTPNSKSLFSPTSPTSPRSPFRFDNPNSVGETIRKTERERKRRYKKRQREEMAWNNGLRCFVERRDAWTGARHVPPPHRLPKRKSDSSVDGDSSTVVEGENPEDEWEDDDIEIPIAPPLIPLANPMRSNITPEAYDTIYDKVVKMSLTPSCPINLKDITRSCVQGWKRDGTWEPPKPNLGAESPKSRRRRLSVANLFTSDKNRQENEREKTKEIDQEKEREKEKKTKPNSQGTIRRRLEKMKILGSKG